MTAPDSLSPSLSLELHDEEAPLAAGAGTGSLDDVRIPFEKFRLDNGLTVIVHENRRAPVVTLNTWYRVGAKDEPAGKTGFAHLFEHLMFMGSRNFPGLYLNNLLGAGAMNLNGTTNCDRTNYYQSVPTAALDYALFAESDRMGHFYETLSQERLDIQRSVVQNEKRQTEGAQYGLVHERVVKGTYPAGHPYAHTVIGSMEDIQSATLEDVRGWFKTYYGPSNAVLVLAGDIDVETARRKVTQYFADIPPGPPLARPRSWIAKMSGIKRDVLEDRVPQGRVHMVWNVPEMGQQDVSLLQLAAPILGTNLEKYLVHEHALASGVSASVFAGSIAGQFSINATVKNGVALERVEQAINEQLQRLLTDGPTAAELERVRTQTHANFIRELDSIFGIADMLAGYEVRLEEPDAYRRFLAWVREATPQSVRDAARRWLCDGVYVLQVVPFPQLKAAASGMDRSKIPAIGKSAGIKLPALHWATLSNGIRIVLAERHELPLVSCGVLLRAGYTADPCESLGVMRLTARLLNCGSGARDTHEFTDARRRIGAKISTNTSLESSGVGLSTIKGQLDTALELFADLILRPQFTETEFARQREVGLELIAQEVSAPGSAISRVVPGLLFSGTHPYARPWSGYGISSQVSQLTRDAMLKCYANWFRPDHATVIVVGDTTMSEIEPKLERCFGGWSGAAAEQRVVPEASPPRGPALYLIDKPDKPQAIIRAATVLPAMEGREALPAKVLNIVLGGTFSSRLNMNLREDKNWSYGVGSTLESTLGPRLFSINAPVQADKTRESVLEIQEELRRIVDSHPVRPEELERVQRGDALRFGGSIGSLSGLHGVIEYLVRKNRSVEYWESQIDRLTALTLDEVNAAARTLLDPARMVWVIAGDLARIEPSLRSLDLGAQQIIEPEGERLYARA